LGVGEGERVFRKGKKKSSSYIGVNSRTSFHTQKDTFGHAGGSLHKEREREESHFKGEKWLWRIHLECDEKPTLVLTQGRDEEGGGGRTRCQNGQS